MFDVVPVRKSKKNQAKIYPQLLLVDKEAFGPLEDQRYIIKQFWNSSVNRIAVAQKRDSKSVIGYACYHENNGHCYLMRICVRTRCQRQGIGRRVMEYLMSLHETLALDVAADNETAVRFYRRIGMREEADYVSEEGVRFFKFVVAKAEFKWAPAAAQREEKKEEVEAEPAETAKTVELPKAEIVVQTEIPMTSKEDTIEVLSDCSGKTRGSEYGEEEEETKGVV